MQPTGPRLHPESFASAAPGHSSHNDAVHAPAVRPEGRQFTAELDLVEFDERGRVTSTWSARACSLSRSNLVVRSRRMIYRQTPIGVLIHLIDATPVPLYARAYHCDYDGDGMYKVDLDLLPLPDYGPVAAWLKSIKS
ncbi:MAG: hypothetical protein DYG94_04335 [Leptolyngbya sp. PLA3]|nr:MAG: hypothetical protein EDM82_07560 [Cyanobacteria bacterium CYA]MCE7967959.1 hypothetical protein [Leptolyngbya sp. PL-A3]